MRFLTDHDLRPLDIHSSGPYVTALVVTIHRLALGVLRGFLELWVLDVLGVEEVGGH